jgi:hypothetical protein
METWHGNLVHRNGATLAAPLLCNRVKDVYVQAALGDLHPAIGRLMEKSTEFPAEHHPQ